jgi:uncharacterized membrane protein
MRRLVYVDVLRGIAILFMVVDHTYDWWLDEAGQATALAHVTEFLGTLAAPLFLYLVGVGMSLSWMRAAREGRPSREVICRSYWRGAGLVLLGYALNLLVFYAGDNPADLWAVDVLQTIGVGIWLSVPLLRAPAWVAIVLTLVVAVVGQTAGQWAMPDWLAAYLTGKGGIGYFPLALWLPFVYLGVAIGRWTAEETLRSRLMIGLGVVGLISLTLSLLVPSSWGYRHPRPVFDLFAVAIAFWLTAGLWLWTGHWHRAGPLVQTLCQMGRASLVIYVLHYLVGYRLFWLFGWVHGRSWRGQYGVFSPLAATLLSMALLGLMVVSSRLWIQWRQRRG